MRIVVTRMLAGDRKAGPLPRLLYTSDYVRLATIRFTRSILGYKVSRNNRSTSLQLKYFLKPAHWRFREVGP